MKIKVLSQLAHLQNVYILRPFAFYELTSRDRHSSLDVNMVSNLAFSVSYMFSNNCSQDFRGSAGVSPNVIG